MREKPQIDCIKSKIAKTQILISVGEYVTAEQWIRLGPVGTVFQFTDILRKIFILMLVVV